VPALRRILPRCYGFATDTTTGEHALFLEFLADVARLDATGAQADWPADATRRYGRPPAGTPRFGRSKKPMCRGLDRGRRRRT
jgi:hypothetical protein